MTSATVIRLVALREVRERLRSRTYLISTAALIILLGGAFALPKILSTPITNYQVGVVQPVPPGLAAALRQAAKPHDATVSIHSYATWHAAVSGLDRGNVNVVLSATDGRIVFRREINRETVAVARQALGMQQLPQRLARAGLTAEQFGRLVAPPRVHVETLESSSGISDRTVRLIALGGASLMLLAISIYGSWVMAGVAQEKTGRVAELLVAAIPPRHLLAGKVIGIGGLGLVQVIIVALAVGVGTALGVTDLPSSFVSGAALVVPWFLLGFGVAGAVVTRQEDVATASVPVTGIMMVSFFLAYGTLQSDPDGTLARIITIFPTTAPFMLPARSAMTGVPAWEHALAVTLTLAALYGLVRLGGHMYSAALLHTSPLAGLTGAWRLRR
jgi:ABC-2 type transport system permease protein